VGAILLGTLQQVASVTISSAVNLLIVGILLVAFVIIAPNGLVGLVQDFARAAAPDRRLSPFALGTLLIAGYGIVAGMFGVVLGLSAVMAVSRAVGMFELVVAVLLITSAYGLLKLQSWGPLLATISFALAVPLGLVQLWSHPTLVNMFMYGSLIVVGAAAAAFLRTAGVKALYRVPSAEQQQVAS
jgi:uncharacterized membrane protein (DUF2068 family)